MQTLLEQPISNHPLFPNIARKVVVYNVNIEGQFSQIVIDAEIRYFDDNQDGREVTTAFRSKLNDWIVSNNELTTVRDNKGKPMPNPQYISQEAAIEKLRNEGIEVPEGEDPRAPEQREEHLKIPSFDYFFGIIKNPKAPSLINLLALHIQGNDQIKFFDKMLNLPIE